MKYNYIHHLDSADTHMVVYHLDELEEAIRTGDDGAVLHHTKQLRTLLVPTPSNIQLDGSVAWDPSTSKDEDDEKPLDERNMADKAEEADNAD